MIMKNYHIYIVFKYTKKRIIKKKKMIRLTSRWNDCKTKITYNIQNKEIILSKLHHSCNLNDYLVKQFRYFRNVEEK